MKKLITSIFVGFAVLLMLSVTGFAADTIKIPPTDYVSGSTTQGLNARGDAVKQYSGSAVGYKINYDVSPSSVILTIGTDATNAGIVELRLDTKGGILLGTVDVSSKAFSWRGVDFTIPILQDISGEHTLWVCFKKGQHDFVGVTLKLPDPNAVYYAFSDGDSFNDIADYKYRNELNILASLGILEPGDKFDPEGLAIKRDWVRGLAGFFEDTAISSKTALYADITPQDPDYKAFAILCEAGVLEANPNKEFKPNQKVTLDWACRMCCTVLNFGFSDGKQLNYLQTARRVGLLSGVEGSSSLRRKDVAMLLYNMLDADYAELIGVEDTILKYDIGRYILERTRNIYKAEGIVSANQNYNIYSNEKLASQDTVIIGGREYGFGDGRAAGYVGLMCTYFYKEDDGVRTIAAIAPHYDAEYIRLNSAHTDIGAITENSVAYYEDNDKELLKLSDKVIVMYNGRVGEGKIESMVGSGTFTGELLLIDNNSDRKYDVLYIEQPKTIVYKGLGKNVVYNGFVKNAQGGPEELTFDDLDNVKIYSTGGAIDWSDLELGDVVDVYASKNTTGEKLFRMYAYKNTAEGIVMEKEGDGKIRLDNDKEYLPVEGFDDEIIVGNSVLLKLNTYGQYVVLEEQESAKLAIILEKGINNPGSAFTKTAAVEFLTQDNKVEVMNFAKKVTADGVECGSIDEIMDGIGSFVGLANLEAQIPVRYLLNSNGEIIMIDTPNKGKGGAMDRLTLMMEKNTKAKFANGNVIATGSWTQLKHLCALAADVKVVSLYEGDDKTLHRFDGSNGVAAADKDRTLTAYSTKPDTMLADLVVWSERGGLGDNGFEKCFVYQNQALKLNADGEVCVVLKGTVSGGKKEYLVSAGTYGQSTEKGKSLKNAVEVLQEGDILQFSLNALGEVEVVQVNYFHDGVYQRKTASGEAVAARVYDDGKDTYNTVAYYSGGGLSACYFGTVVAQEDNFLKVERRAIINATTGEVGTVYDYVNTATASSIILCETKDGKLEINNDASNAEIGIGSTVFVSETLHSWGRPEFIAVYK